MKLTITILGCGTSIGVPSINGNWGVCDPKNSKNYRSRCSLHILRGNNSVVVDTSPDLRAQCLKNNIKNISSVIYTHEHADQTHGINDLRAIFLKNKKKINIYGNNETINYLKSNFTYCFKTTFGYPSILNANKIKKKFSLGYKKNKINFESFEVEHGKINSVAYIFEKIAYLSDCSNLTKSNLNKLKNLDLLFIDCLRFNDHYSHLTYSKVLNIISLIKPKKTILTNLNNEMDYNYLLKILPKNIKPGYDGMKFKI
jgi:phosphoribosyl 1,2-cyclic phosphate phosphodiesterase|tara:strand:+ start:11939 stop:12709 length:771 start_codon:yes stop_codon:yes gene_type:complete